MVMIQLNEVSLLDMTRVCRRFRAIAKEAFAKKYTGKTDEDYYELRLFCENEIEEHKRYRPYFRVFGENMIAVDIRFFRSINSCKRSLVDWLNSTILYIVGENFDSWWIAIGFDWNHWFDTEINTQTLEIEWP